MRSRQKKEKKQTHSEVFFDKKPQTARLHDLKQLQAACDYLKNSNPSGDSQRKQMRGVQLAQQLIDPKIESVQTILAVLELKKQQLLTGQILPESEVNTLEDNTRRYPNDYFAPDYDKAWMHYVNSLLRIPMEDSLIETDVYNYVNNSPIVIPDSFEDANVERINTSSTQTRALVPVNNQIVPAEDHKTATNKKKGNFFTRFFRRK
ncbi:MAG: hypothetical protein AAF849_05430 [Bacteroidota bacterium]